MILNERARAIVDAAMKRLDSPNISWAAVKAEMELVANEVSNMAWPASVQTKPDPQIKQAVKAAERWPGQGDSKASHILLHTLGLDRQPVPYRNYFVAGPSSEHFARCEVLVEMGLMTRRDGGLGTVPGDFVYSTTEAGRAAALALKASQ